MYYVLGKLYLANKDFEKAESLILKAVTLEPGLSSAYTDLGKIYTSIGNEDMARSNFRDALSKNPNDAGALMMLGLIEQRSGNIPEAQSHYERVLALKPEFVPAANNLAYIYSEYGGDLDKAFRLAQQAYDAEPEDPNIADTFGWILYKQQDYRWALSLFEKSASKLPENPEVWYHLGMAQFKAGNAEEARASLEKALELSSEFNGAQEAKDTLETLN